MTLVAAELADLALGTFAHHVRVAGRVTPRMPSPAVCAAVISIPQGENVAGDVVGQLCHMAQVAVARERLVVGGVKAASRRLTRIAGKPFRETQEF